jgi:hypothetical protein
MDAPTPPGRDPTPEARARQVIDAALTNAGWIVQDRADLNLHAGPGIAVRETPTATGPADYTRTAPAQRLAWAGVLSFAQVFTGAKILTRGACAPRVLAVEVLRCHSHQAAACK